LRTFNSAKITACHDAAFYKEEAASSKKEIADLNRRAKRVEEVHDEHAIQTAALEAQLSNLQRQHATACAAEAAAHAHEAKVFMNI